VLHDSPRTTNNNHTLVVTHVLPKPKLGGKHLTPSSQPMSLQHRGTEAMAALLRKSVAKCFSFKHAVATEKSETRRKRYIIKLRGSIFRHKNNLNA
jgi:hypothetical protein